MLAHSNLWRQSMSVIINLWPVGQMGPAEMYNVAHDWIPKKNPSKNNARRKCENPAPEVSV